MLSQIHIINVRNISEIKILLGDHLNIFFGENGSGKSSVLESIYMLSTGKSFRTRQITKVIKENENKLTLFGKLEKYTLGVERSTSGRKLQINGELVKQFSALAKCLPVLVITQDSHKLLESGPQWRREFVDWGLFHVEHEFHSTWKNYRKSLKNRNSLLKNNAELNEIAAWNDGLASCGEIYSRLREEYLNELLPLFRKYATYLLGDYEFDLSYKRGWPKEIGLLACFESHFSKDKFSGRTNYGPHRADITVSINGRDAKDRVSRGQQKILVYALYFSQATFLQEKTKKETLILLDDLGAELDIEHTRKLLTLVSKHFSQVCITSANLDSLPLDEYQDIKMFHVEHGSVKTVSPDVL